MSATVIPFPCRRRVGKARHVALKYLDAIDHRPGTSMSYYRQVERNLRNSMEKAGVDLNIIDQELKDFAMLVGNELYLAGKTHSDTGDCA